jgi:formate dehydrogenase iron-sulfur subunit
MGNATLIDTTKCIGCRSCQVTCKQWNDLSAEKTALQGADKGYTNPGKLSAKTFVVLTSHEVADDRAPGGLRYAFAKRQCMHCQDPACASACPVTAFHRSGEGAVAYDASKCIGCRYCAWACPFGVPTAEWDSLSPRMRKCTMCQDRLQQAVPEERNGQKLTDEERKRFAAAYAVPACVKQCPAGALQFGDREALVREAKARIAKSPGKYVDHVYGEKEAGGTNMLYLAAVPFDRLGFRTDVGDVSYPHRSATALKAVPPAVIAVGASLGGVYALSKRRAEVEKHEHPSFAPVPSGKLWTPANLLLAALMAFGGLSFVARFALGLGGSTNLSDTYAWGLWIVFDLVWIAIAAGAFATAGLIYAFRRDELYSVGRSAVLMGLLSYSFVTVTLLADLGQPWHFYQLALQAPEHSAMFEVAWCVGLYVTVLAFEFMPVPFERWGLKGAMDAWKRWSPWYVVLAVSLFVWLMSRNVAYTAVAAAVFSGLAYAFRTRPGEKPVPITLAIAAVTLSTMHQSSLGSLFLLMPDKLDPAWWSPVMPLAFFLSSIAAGLGLVILVEMWIAKAFDRKLRMPQLAALGRAALWALLAYGAFRLGDVAARGQLGHAFARPLFLAEVLLGLAVPIALLASPGLRSRPAPLGIAAALATGGVVLNRMSVVILEMTLRGPMPQDAAQPYAPSLVEWGISLGLVAATIFLFGLAIRHLPVLPVEERSP